ncbi:uncharacterized protein B0H64DRAFT_472377 [Chaetomium fimeti]|uniref:Rhomboid family membrane protein n=1 Tax=Chaetomium fimeti TaxID=1854472 RepID=A0AAE0LVM2_9PEZI|nr:hypothetical protein B0H64DRAFT_472377 [Chaetomium fimeti]
MTSPSETQPPPPPHSQPTTTPTTTTPTPPLPSQNPLLHSAAIALAILCPIALFLPTRGGGRAKPLLQNAVLGAGGFWGVNQLATDYTGKALTDRWGERFGAVFGSGSADKGKLGGDKERGDGGGGGGGDKEGGGAAGVGLLGSLPTERAARNKMLIEAERKRRAEAEGREYKPRKESVGLVERFWMGGEKEGWQEKRLEEERKAIESGKGYGGLIADQVREVWKGKGDGEGGKKGEGERQGDGKGKKE